MPTKQAGVEHARSVAQRCFEVIENRALGRGCFVSIASECRKFIDLDILFDQETNQRILQQDDFNLLKHYIDIITKEKIDTK